MKLPTNRSPRLLGGGGSCLFSVRRFPPARQEGQGPSAATPAPQRGDLFAAECHSLTPNPPKVWRYSSGMGDEGQGEAMVRARFRVNGAGVCLQPPRGDLATVWGRWARRDGGERTQQEGLADQGGASLRGVRLAGWRVSCRRAPSGWEWNRSQPCQGASELGFPRPALGQMQGKAAR